MKHYLSSIVSLAVLLFATVSCGKGESVVKSHSTTIRYCDPITITLKDGLSFDSQVCRDNASVISISGGVEFDMRPTDDGSSLLLSPRTPLKYNGTYTVSGKFSKLCGQRGGKEKFTVRVLAPMAKASWSPLTRQSEKDVYCITLTIESADPLDAAYLEKRTSYPHSMVKNIAWTHSADGLQHEALFSGISADKKASDFSISLSYDAYSINVNKLISIPGAENFCVLDAQMIQDPYHYEVSFSDMVDPKQDFASLVSMPGAGKLSFVVNGNILSITPSVRVEDKQELRILKSLNDNRSGGMDEEYVHWFTMPSQEPFIRFVSRGSILPSASGMKVAVESANYRSMRVRCRRIYENNIIQFLQDNSLSSSETYTSNVARIVLDTVFMLGTDEQRLASRQTYGLDLTSMIKVQKGAIYKVEIGGVDPMAQFREDRYESDYWLGDWEDYSKRTRNILVSDLALIVKGGTDGEYTAVVTDIINATPVSGAVVEFYNDVNQLLSSGTSDSQGRYTCVIKGDKPRTVVAGNGHDKAYLTVKDGEALSLSTFDVAGVSSKGGVKAFIFGERGVWRPGDDIHLCLMAVADKGELPSDLPVSVTFYNPQGQLMSTLNSNDGHNGMYAFCLKTDKNAPTGKWNAVFTLGAQQWSKTVRVESVKPNNIIADLDFKEEIPQAAKIEAVLHGRWLVGNPAANLNASIEVTLAKGKTQFPAFSGYVFTDEGRQFKPQTESFFKGTTDASGKMAVSGSVDIERAPGLLDALFTTRVFETNGEFSTSTKSITLSPYRQYVGVKVPLQRTEWGTEYVDKTRSCEMQVAVVDASGHSVDRATELTVDIYKKGWNWWWSSSAERIASFARDTYSTPYKSFRQTVKGKGVIKMNFSSSDSGYYFVRVSDEKGGHASSVAFLVCNMGEEAPSDNMTSATVLPISADKTTYTVGQTARLTVPSAERSRAFVSLEKGGRVFRTFWVECSAPNTVIEIPLTLDMTPDIYASVTLIQPYNTSANDSPIRMFGVQRLNVEDALTHIEPVINVPSEVCPESSFTVSVSERNGRPMSYVLAVVDEGLLNLTSFRTPDPWKCFFETEALGVRTWDLYNSVIGAYGARMEQVFAVGGDGENTMITPESKAQRFPPVALFYGPYTIKSRATGKTQIDMPRYMGNVRVMVIAGDGRNAGSAQTNIQVTKPVMAKLSLPRVIGTGDEVQVPVTVMTTRDGVGSVKLSLSTEGPLAIDGKATASVRLDKVGEAIANFTVKASELSGVAKVKVLCQSGSDTSTDEVEIDVRDANPRLRKSEVVILEGGESRKVDYAFEGIPGTSKMKVEASVLPAIDLDGRLGYLIEYPHGCLEQTVSSAFPQLYLAQLADMDDATRRQCAYHVGKALAALPSYALSDGGFTTWPSTDASPNTWAGLYATHFILEAERYGYAVNRQFRKNALSYAFRVADDTKKAAIYRAYATYVLALSGSPARSAMSRLREGVSNLGESEILLLALSYAADGKKDIARSMIRQLPSEGTENPNPFALSYPSTDRTLALRALLSSALSDAESAFPIVADLASRLNDPKHFMSTQSTSWALFAVASYVKSNPSDGKLDVALSAAGDRYALKSDKTVARASVKTGATDRNMVLDLVNNSSSRAFITLSSVARGERGDVVKRESGISIRTEYRLPDGTSVDPASLPAGTDFVCKCYVTNRSLRDYTNIALSQLFPCGWEIRPETVEERGLYQDFRDDRVYSYFSLPRESTYRVTIRLTASYKGSYYHPATSVEAMYDNSVSAVLPGFDVRVE